MRDAPNWKRQEQATAWYTRCHGSVDEAYRLRLRHSDDCVRPR